MLAESKGTQLDSTAVSSVPSQTEKKGSMTGPGKIVLGKFPK